MVSHRQFLRLENPIKDYAWGHATLINELLGRDPKDGRPQAELWLGTHPAGPSLVEDPVNPDAGQVSLATLIAQQPERFLGSDLRTQGVENLPFLFKLIAAQAPLSIQAHPNLAAAQAGFAAETAAGLALTDSCRNYKDPNHKPEIVCAISDFYGLCGFRAESEIRADFAQLAESSSTSQSRKFFGDLTEYGADRSIVAASYNRKVCTSILRLPDYAPVIADLVDYAKTRTEERFVFLQEAAELYPGDRGLLFFVALQLHKLNPGEALCIPAGVLHAYLRGFAVELMANSDNILRGGLTPKHIDVEELLKNLDCQASGLRIRPADNFGRFDFSPFTWEFCLSHVQSRPGDTGQSASFGSAAVPQIMLCTAGSARISSTTGEILHLNKGQSAYILPEQQSVDLLVNGEVFVAGVALAVRQQGVVLGIDGGGTSTRACLMDQSGRVLAIGHSGPSSIDTVSLAETELSIQAAVAQAQQMLGQPKTIVAAVAGIGGIVSAEDEDQVSAMLRRLSDLKPEAPCRAVNDMKTAWAAGTLLQPGMVCILGTGSVVYGRTAQGEECKSGGWGYKEGDPGSSYDLGMSAIRSMVRSFDGRQSPTDFDHAVYNQLGLTAISDITRKLYQQNISRTDIAALAPLVTGWSDRADPHALAIVDRAVADVVEMVLAVFHNLFANVTAALPLAIVGSLGNAKGYYQNRLTQAIAVACPRIVMQKAILDPVVGAALLALQQHKGSVRLTDLDIATLQQVPGA